MKKHTMVKYNKYLIVFLSQGGLGEVILQTPFFRALKSDCPKAEIHILISRNNIKVLDNNPYISKIYSYTSIKQLILQFLKIKFTHFHTCFVLDKSWKSIYLSKIFTTTKNLFGFNRLNWESFPLTYKINYNASKHESQYYIDLLKCDHTHDLAPQLFPKQSDYTFLGNYNFPDKTRVIALLAGGANNPATGDESFRRWPIENYCELAKKFSDIDYTILLVGGSSDINLNQKIENHCQARSINLTAKLSLVQSGIALSTASLVICNDSGLMHLASCFNQNLLCLLHMISPISVLPQVHNAQYLWVDEDIYDARARIFGTFKIPNDKKEMYLKRLTVSSVYEKATKMLSNSPD